VFNEAIQRHVEQFNQQLSYSTEFHQRFLAALCTQRVNREVETLQEEIVRPTGVVSRVLRGLRAERAGEAMPRGAVLLKSEEQGSPQVTDKGAVIEGEFRVIEESGESKSSSQPSEDIPISRRAVKGGLHNGTR
jgi:hypothetical protein